MEAIMKMERRIAVTTAIVGCLEVAMGVGALCAIGFTGGLEMDNITIAQFLTYETITAAAMYVMYRAHEALLDLRQDMYDDVERRLQRLVDRESRRKQWWLNV